MEESITNNFIQSIVYQLETFKRMGEKAIDQIDDEQFYHQPDVNSLSIATIVQHLPANMRSRWTDFLTTDGEKEWRRKTREDEFIQTSTDRQELMKTWNDGWKCFIETVGSLTGDDLGKIVYIRNEGYTVIEAIHRGLCHAAYHIGQIVYLAKMYRSEKWQSLSIPKGESVAFNQQKFNQEKSRRFK